MESQRLGDRVYQLRVWHALRDDVGQVELDEPCRADDRLVVDVADEDEDQEDDGDEEEEGG